MAKKRLKLGLALGGGSARGLAHIGILKSLHKHKIYPDYIAGTSMGAVIGAFYTSGHSPEEIEDFFKTADWKKLIDFTVPKAGLIQGSVMEEKLRRILHHKSFDELDPKLKVVAYNLDQMEKVVFSKGDVARAVRASMSIPGIFSPIKIAKHIYVDGGVVDPTPYDVVREMGAEVVIAVDLFSEDGTTKKGPEVKEKSFFAEVREKFIVEELLQLKKYLIPKYWPDALQNIFDWVFDKLLYPARIIKMMMGRELPQIAKVMNKTYGVLIANLARERMKNAQIEVKITPAFPHLSWADFDKVAEFTDIGEKAMDRKMGLLRNELRKS